MKLSNGQIIEVRDDFLVDIEHDLHSISSINTYEEEVVYDLTSSTGFFSDLEGIEHKQCGSHSVEYIKKNGLNLNTVLSKSRPARSASVLVNHLLTFSATIQNQFAGAVGYDAVNIFFAPFFVDKSYKQIKQVAQELFYGFSQSAFSRGGQSLFSDLNFYLTVPAHYAKAKALGPGGKYVKLIEKSSGAMPEYEIVESTKEEASTYKDFEPWAQQFCKAVLEVCREGDSTGMPFAFPKCLDGNTELLAMVDDQVCIKSVREVHELHESGSEIYLPRYNQELMKTEWVRVKGSAYRGQEIGTALRLQNNIFLNSSSDHRYYVWDDGELLAKEAQDLKISDVLAYADPLPEPGDKLVEVDLLDLLGDYEDLQVHNVTKPSYTYSAKRKNWRRMSECSTSDLTEGSYITGFKQKINKHPMKMTVDRDFGSLLGYFVSEGSFGNHYVSISCKDLGRCFEPVSSLLDRMGYPDNHYEGRFFHIHDEILKRLLQKLVPSYHNHASQKAVPSVILRSPSEVRVSFLRALFDGDGTSKPDQYAYSTSSHDLSFGVQILLASIGIPSTIYETTCKDYPGRIYYLVSVKGRNAIRKFSQLFPNLLDSPNVITDKADPSWYNTIPTSLLSEEQIYPYEKRLKKYVSRETAGNPGGLFDCFIPLPISSISECNVETYAIEVDCPGHDFITASGVLTKNCDVHLEDSSFEPKNEWLLDELVKTAAENGSPYFIFDRGDARKISQCCRLQKTFGENDFKVAEETPEDIRFQAIQNITLNLPRVAYRFRQEQIEGLASDPFEFAKVELDRLLGICIRAHKAKKKYIKKLLSLPGTPLHLLKYGMDGKGYMDLDKALFLVGLLGLNEMVQALCGKELHESDEAQDLGLRIIAYISLRAAELGDEEGLNVVVEESPAESTSKRLAKLDDYYFNGAALRYVRGNKESGAIYYTNSIHLREDCGMSFVERIRRQSKFHPMITGGSIIHLWVGENIPSPESIKNLARKIHFKTRAQQVTISPEFTLCEKCTTRMNGLRSKCTNCGNDDQQLLTQITRVVGYFSKVSNFVDSKKEELKRRQRDFDVEWGEE